VLYLLCQHGTTYGYQILEEIPAVAMTDSEIDVGAVYRVLRTLEQAGCVTSHWEPGPGGPNRRVYKVTRVGRQHLEDWASVLERRGRQMVDFAGDCKQLKG